MNPTTIGFPINKKGLMQNFFNWKQFYKLKSCEKFPAILCFPDFFANSVFAILNWYSLYYQNEQKSHFIRESFIQIYRFFSILESIINIIINNDQLYIKLKSADEIQEALSKIIRDNKNSNNNKNNDNYEHYFLEWYMENETSQLNYQKALIEANFAMNKVDNIDDLIKLLYDEGSCLTREVFINNYFPNSRPNFPHSIHYVNQSKTSNHSKLPVELRGPPSWGPMYWNIFHTLPKNASTITSMNHEVLLKILYAMIFILPLIVPCRICMIHYLQNVRPSKIEFTKSISEYENLYETIHNIVSLNK